MKQATTMCFPTSWAVGCPHCEEMVDVLLYDNVEEGDIITCEQCDKPFKSVGWVV